VVTKLTLRLDEALIHKAKQYSEKSGKSVSQLVADYFALIVRDLPDERDEITPRVRSLFGVLSGSGLTENDYQRHLAVKHR